MSKRLKIIEALLLYTLMLSATLSAQWSQIKIPSNGLVLSLAIRGSNFFAGTLENGVFLSTDNGSDWVAINTGLTNTEIHSLTFSGANLFAGTYGGVFLSADNGLNWTAVSNGLTNTYVQCVEVDGTNLFAGTLDGVFLSTDNGSNWTAVNNGLPRTQVYCLKVDGTNLFAGTLDGVFLSTNKGKNWTKISSGLTNGLSYPTVNCLAVSGNTLFAGTGNGIFLSTNNGSNWTAVVVDTGIAYAEVIDLAVRGSTLFAAIYHYGVFLTINSGLNWTSVNAGLKIYEVYSLTVSDTNLFLGTSDGSIWSRPLSEILYAKERTPDLPIHFGLSQNFPNPFNPSTTIDYQITTACHVILRVFDVLGRDVAILVNERESVGSYSIAWNASRLPSGVYFYQLKAGSFIESKKMILTR